MTPRGERKPAPLRPVMPRVEFGPGGTVTMETTGFPPETLEPETVSLMFSAGLTVPERVRSPEQASSSWLVLHGSVRFLVGTLDVGSKRGLRAIVRGIAAAAETDLHDVREEETADVTAADQQQQRPWRVTIEPDDEDDRPQLIVNADDVAASIDDLIGQASHGTDVIITRDGIQVAVMVAWSWYARRREHLARLAAAHWAAWRGGSFDKSAYALDLQDLRRHGRLARAATQPMPDEPGDGDDDTD